MNTSQLKSLNFFIYTVVLCALFAPLISSPVPSQASYSYILKILFPQDIHPSLRGYYKGEILDLHDGWTTINEEERTNTFSLIFTDEIIEAKDGTSTKHLERSSKKPILWYDITLTFIDNKTLTWNIEKKASKSVPLRLPNNAIVIRINPKFIEKISMPSRVQSPDSNHILYMPTIVMKQHLTEKEESALEENMLYGIMASLDLDRIHARTSKNIQRHNNRVCIFKR